MAQKMMFSEEPKKKSQPFDQSDDKVFQQKPPAVAMAASKIGESVTVHTSKISEKRRERWMALLAKRPSTKDGESMSGWLMDVLAVSDLETPLKPEDDFEDEAKAVSKVRDDTDEKLSTLPGKSTNDLHSHAVGNVTNEEEPEKDNYGKGGKDKFSSVAFNGNILKKKRPAAELLRDGSEQAKPKTASYVKGTFAEWKERKKQKKQSKTTNVGGGSAQDNP